MQSPARGRQVRKAKSRDRGTKGTWDQENKETAPASTPGFPSTVPLVCFYRRRVFLGPSVPGLRCHRKLGGGDAQRALARTPFARAHDLDAVQQFQGRAGLLGKQRIGSVELVAHL